MPDPLVTGTFAVCNFIASQIAIRSKKMNKEKRIIQTFHKSLLLILTSSFSVFMVADILSSTIGLGTESPLP